MTRDFSGLLLVLTVWTVQLPSKLSSLGRSWSHFAFVGVVLVAGFVGFGTVEEAEKAMKEMDGKEIVGRAIKIGFARVKKEKPVS